MESALPSSLWSLPMHRPLLLTALLALLAGPRPAIAQNSYQAATAAELAANLAQAFANTAANPAATNTITLTATISATTQMVVNANVNIVGQGFTLDMGNLDRAFFIAGGTVGISDLTIQNGRAAGGSGGLGGGGGAGLGGGIFVGSGSYSGWTTDDNPQPIVAAQGVSVPTLTLSGVSFANNTAIGGGSTFVFGDGLASGGGGMGGNGSDGGGDSGGGGGGGFGTSAAAGGGTGSNGAAGAFVNVSPTSGNTLSAGSGGNGGGSGGAGGANGGGGGGGSDVGSSRAGSGGGGGVGGGRGYFTNSTPPNNGGNGGFGGGGGGNDGEFGSAGNGGFGGGGGGSIQSGGNGGFGGGGGKANGGSPGTGGFGAASATPTGSTGNDSAAGGGLGAGGAVFVMAGASVTVTGGSFASNSVTGGSGGNGNNGSAYGADLFLGGTVTFDVPTTLTVDSLGGAGNTSDPNVAGHTSDPNAQGGVVKTGAGALLLTGSNYFVGPTTVRSGTLALAVSALEQGTSSVTVGLNSGDVATLTLGSSSTLNLGGFTGPSGSDLPVMLAQNAGSTGTVVIGSGPGTSGADIGAREFTGGAGTAAVVFSQQYAAGSTTDATYPFYTTLTGSLAIVQDGVGITQLEPLYGPNSFTGPATVNAGTLSTAGATAALGGVSGITVNTGGLLALGQTGGINDAASLVLAGGGLQTAASLTESLGGLTVSGSSLIDFLSNASTLNFSTLTLSAPLAVWNYTAGSDAITVASGTATGSLDQVTFYSDAGQTLLGTGGFSGTSLVPLAVPEPAALGVVGVALLGGSVMVRRRWRMRSKMAPEPRAG